MVRPDYGTVHIEYVNVPVNLWHPLRTFWLGQLRVAGWLASRGVTPKLAFFLFSEWEGTLSGRLRLCCAAVLVA